MILFVFSLRILKSSHSRCPGKNIRKIFHLEYEKNKNQKGQTESKCHFRGWAAKENKYSLWNTILFGIKRESTGPGMRSSRKVPKENISQNRIQKELESKRIKMEGKGLFALRRGKKKRPPSGLDPPASRREVGRSAD